MPTVTSRSCTSPSGSDTSSSLERPTTAARPPGARHRSPAASAPGAPEHSSSTSNSGARSNPPAASTRSEEHTSELQSRENLVCRLLLEKKNREIVQHHRSGLGL